MARTKYRHITMQIAVRESDVEEVMKLLRESLDVIHADNTIYNQAFVVSGVDRPENADEYGDD